MRAVFALSFILCFAFLTVPASSRVRCKRCIKVLNTDIKNAAKKSMTAVVQAGVDLTRLRDQFGQEQANLAVTLKKAKAMTETINDKIKKAVKETTAIMEEASRKVREKLQEVTSASDALGVIEDKMGSAKIKSKAKAIRTQIAKGHAKETKLQKNVMDENGIIATLDAAKILAKAKEEKHEKNIEDKQAIVKSDVQALEKKMSSAKQQLDNEEQLELEDTNEARSKILEAVKHNQLALRKAKGFLESIEEGIKKFHSDVEQVPLDY